MIRTTQHLDILEELEQSAREIPAELARETAQRARELAPEFLRAHIEAREADVVVDHPAAAVIEFGGAHQPARPFLTPAIPGK